MNTQHAFRPNPAGNGRCIEGLSQQHAGVACGQYADHPSHSATPQAAGWSRRRRPTHPLGTAVHVGNGYTEYADELTGTNGTVQIWDRS